MREFVKLFTSKRIELGLSQDEVAERLHVTRQAVSKWETGKAMPDVALMPQIAEILGVSVEELITGNEPAPRVIEKVIIQEKEVKRPMPVRKILAIVAPIVLVVVLASALLGVYIPKAIAANTPPIVETPEPEPPQPILTNGFMYYDFDLEVTNKIRFLFRPKYSGKYVLTYGDDELTAKVGGVDVKSGYTRYYVGNDTYIVDYEIIPEAKPYRYQVYASFEPELVESSAHVELKSYNDYVLKMSIDEPWLYRVSVNGVPYHIYDREDKEVKAQTDDIYYLGDTAISPSTEIYTIVLDHQRSGTKLGVDIEINKLDLDVITVDKAQKFETIPISGKAGELKFFELEVTTDDALDEWYFYTYYSYSDAPGGYCNLLYMNVFTSVPGLMNGIGRWNDEYGYTKYGYTFHAYSRIEPGKYYLEVEFYTDTTLYLVID